METDWSVAAGPDDPIIELPWSDAESGTAWVDLRVPPDLQAQRIAALPEAHRIPALARALEAWNAPAGLLQTTKCDHWPLDAEELADTADLLDEAAAAFGFGSYIDVLFAPPAAMADFLLHEEWARTTARRAAAASIANARMELIVRPARAAEAWGFGVTVYCYAVGDIEQQALASWAQTLEATVPLLIAAADELLPIANGL